MSMKEIIFSMMVEALEEAVEVSHDRYMRSHGKKARDTGQSGNWMFTHKSTGDVDYNDDKQVHNARGKFADAKKSAQAWAKEHGHRTVYVMESVEQINELSPNTLHSYIKKSAGNMAGNAAVAAAQASSSMRKSSPEVKRNIKNRMKGITSASGKLADKANMAEEADLDEQIKGWKNAGRDLAKWRSAQGKDVKLVSLKKDGTESKMHDASKMFRSEDEAQEHHERITKLNPKSKIRHNLYVDGKHIKTLGEEVELDEGIKEKIGGIIRRQKEKEYPLLQNRRDVAADKAAKAYAKGDEKKGNRYMTWRSNNMKKEEVELDENLGKASKKMKFMFNTDPRDVKQRIKDASPEFRDQIRNTPGKLGGPAELQRRLARKMKEEVELDEETMPGNVALRLVDRHQAAAFHHKKNGNMKGYAAHFKVAERIEDAVIRAGRDMPVKSKQLEAASDKAFKDHPHRVVKN